MKRSSILVGLCASLLIVAPLSAAWKDYTYPELGFLVTFPADPKIETGMYRTVDGAMLPDRIFTVEQDGLMFRITVVDLKSTTTTKADVIKFAVNEYLKRGELVEDTFARIGSEFGRNLNIAGKNGTRTVSSVFFTTARRLYLIEGNTLPGNKDTGSGLPTRFRESLSFVGPGAGDEEGGERGGGAGGARGGGRGGARGGGRGAPAPAAPVAPAPEN